MTDADKPFEQFGRFIRGYYVGRAWSRAAAAQRAGFSEGFLAHICAGDIAPAHPLARQMLTRWGIDPSELPV